MPPKYLMAKNKKNTGKKPIPYTFLGGCTTNDPLGSTS